MSASNEEKNIVWSQQQNVRRTTLAKRHHKSLARRRK